MLILARCVLVKSKLLWLWSLLRLSEVQISLMSYQEFKLLVGQADVLLGVLFCHYFCLQTVILKACLLGLFILLRNYFCYLCIKSAHVLSIVGFTLDH